ncbi:MAG: ParB N-terminal domain-containing protein [Chloroflexota bacterium]|nr:ParB N-terminal domain-containing protein [Chloroflexota bacterium]
MSEHDAGAVAAIPLDRIRANEDYQPRLGGLSERHVRLLLEGDPAAWPPALVTPNDLGGFDLVDGFHRLEAARRLGLPALRCRVDPDAGYFAAVAANLAHGLPLALADRKAAARWLAEQVPGLSLREIGRRVGLNHETVKRAVEEGEPEAGDDRQSRRPDPIGRLVRQVERAYAGGYGRSWGGFGKAGNAKPFRQELERYAEEDRPAVARAMDAFGRAIVDAAAPFLPPDGDG